MEPLGIFEQVNLQPERPHAHELKERARGRKPQVGTLVAARVGGGTNRSAFGEHVEQHARERLALLLAAVLAALGRGELRLAPSHQRCT